MICYKSKRIQRNRSLHAICTRDPVPDGKSQILGSMGFYAMNSREMVLKGYQTLRENGGFTSRFSGSKTNIQETKEAIDAPPDALLEEDGAICI
jgi:hypothetical protein